jgi:hypothetical protein
MASRTVLVRLDPDMPAPELRTGFAITSLDTWILDPANQRTVLWHLLILVTDWTAHGAPNSVGPAMRQFTPWARALGGFLDHHRIPGFLGNAAEVTEIDADADTWGAFLAKWHDLHADRRLSANELRADAEPDSFGIGTPIDKWDGLFLTNNAGRLPSPKSLGRLLRGQVGRWRGPYVLRRVKDDHTKIWAYSVEYRATGELS